MKKYNKFNPMFPLVNQIALIYNLNKKQIKFALLWGS